MATGGIPGGKPSPNQAVMHSAAASGLSSESRILSDELGHPDPER